MNKFFINFGIVESVGDNVCKVRGLTNAKSEEMVEFYKRVGKEKLLDFTFRYSETPIIAQGQVLNLEPEYVGIVIFGTVQCVRAGDIVRRTGKIIEVTVGKDLSGHVVNGLGVSVDGKKIIFRGDRE